MAFEDWKKQVQTTGGFDAWQKVVTKPTTVRPAVDPSRSDVFTEDEISQFGTPEQKSPHQVKI